MSSYNYDCLRAKNCDEALKKFNQNKDKIDLVISDIIMQDKNGFQLAGSLKEKKDDLNVIFISGYSHQKFKTEKFKEKGDGFIQKPFKAEKLLKMVNKNVNST